MRYGLPGVAQHVWQAELVVVVLSRQRVVYASRLVRVVAHDGEVGLVDVLVFNRIAQQFADLAIERKDQDTGGTAIKAMHGMNALPDLVAQNLHGEARFVQSCVR